MSRGVACTGRIEKGGPGGRPSHRRLRGGVALNRTPMTRGRRAGTYTGMDDFNSATGIRRRARRLLGQRIPRAIACVGGRATPKLPSRRRYRRKPTRRRRMLRTVSFNGTRSHSSRLAPPTRTSSRAAWRSCTSPFATRLPAGPAPSPPGSERTPHHSHRMQRQSARLTTSFERFILKMLPAWKRP